MNIIEVMNMDIEFGKGVNFKTNYTDLYAYIKVN